MKKEISAKKKKCNAEQGDESTSKKKMSATMYERVSKQALKYNPQYQLFGQNSPESVCILNVSKYFIFHKSFLILLLNFYVSLCSF